MKTIKYMFAVLLSIAVAACGGGGGGGGTSTGVVINGTAAAGAPIVGTVQAKDSKGTLFGPVTIGTDGKYSLSVTGGVAPFIVQAHGTVGTATVAVYSVADSPNPYLNINPLTSVVVAAATGLDPASIFNSCSSASCATPVQARVDLGRQQVQVLLQDLLTKFGVTGTINLLTDALVAGPVAGQSPIDKMLDAVNIAPVSGTPTSFEIKPNPVTGLPATTVLVTVPAPPAGGVTTVTTTPLAVDPSLTPAVVTNTATALTALQGIQSQFTVLQGLFASAVPSASDPTLNALFDASFNNWGQGIGAFLNLITGANGASAGITFTNVVAAAPRPAPATQVANDATHQWFTFVVTNPGQPAELNGPWLAVFDSVSQKWLVAGNQMPTPTFVATYTSSTPMADAGGTTWTHVENNTVSGGLVNINHTYTSTANNITGQFVGSGLTLTIDTANTRHATFTGSGTLDNYVGSVGGTSNLRTTTMTGELWVQNDGSINMYWSAPDPLGGTVGGCSSTVNTGCPVAATSTTTTPPASIVGTWAMSGANFTSLVLLADGRFMVLDDNGAGNCQDMEAGTYTYNAATSQLALTVMYDTSATCGAWHGATPTVAAPVTTTVTFDTSTGVLSSATIPATTFTKLATGTSAVGTWLFTPVTGTDFAVLVNYADGRFMYAESPSVTYPSPTGRGLETGTYAATASTYSFSTVTFDGNGSTSGVNGVVGLTMPMAVTDANHIAVTTPDSVSHAMVRQ